MQTSRAQQVLRRCHFPKTFVWRRLTRRAHLFLLRLRKSLFVFSINCISLSLSRQSVNAKGSVSDTKYKTVLKEKKKLSEKTSQVRLRKNRVDGTKHKRAVNYNSNILSWNRKCWHSSTSTWEAKNNLIKLSTFHISITVQKRTNFFVTIIF